MKFAPVALSLFFGLISSASADSDIQIEIRELEAAIAAFKAEHGDFEELSARVDYSEEEITAAKETLPELESEIDQLERLRNIYRSSFRVVTALQPGTSLGVLSLNDGTSVSGAVYTGADGRGISISTSGGPRTIDRALLPDDLKSKFNFPPDHDEGENTLRQLMSFKPDVIVVEQNLAAASSPQSEAPTEAAAAIAPKPTQNPEVAAIIEKREQLLDRLGSLRELAAEVRSERSEIKKERDQIAYEFRSATIKRSKVETDRILEGFDNRIEAKSKKEREIFDEMNKLQKMLRDL